MTQEALLELFQAVAGKNLFPPPSELVDPWVQEKIDPQVTSPSYEPMSALTAPEVQQRVAAQVSLPINDRTAGTTAADSIPLGNTGETSASDQPSQPANSTGAGDTILSIASKVFESGFGLIPLVSGLFGLFGGGETAPPPLAKFAMPERLAFSGSETADGISQSDYDQWGIPRAFGPPASPAESNYVPAPGTGNSERGSTAPQITVNVQAMDSRSFLDHSNEIAQAVRQAMLNLSSINDVVNEL